jgi:hypothetical protein
MNKRIEDMTPDELAFADAWCERQIARAERKMAGMRKAAEQSEKRAMQRGMQQLVQER